MARRSYAEPIYQAAARWKDECLPRGGSLFMGSSVRLWTPENVGALENAFTGNPLLGSEAFLEKLHTQMEGVPAEVIQLAAEMLWVLFLFPRRLLSPERKRGIVSVVWSWSGETLDPEHPLLTQDLLSGVGSAGTAFNTRRDLELEALIAATQVIQDELTSAPWVFKEPWSFAKRLDQDPAIARRNIRHILLHLLFPDQFERIASASAKRKIADAFSQRLGLDLPARRVPLVEIDRALGRIREMLELARPGQEVDFYDDPELHSVWAPEAEPEPPPPEADRDSENTLPSASPDLDLNDAAWGGVSFAHTLARWATPSREPDSDLLFLSYLLIAENSRYSSRSGSWLKAHLVSTRKSRDLSHLLAPYGISALPDPDAEPSRAPVGPAISKVLAQAKRIRDAVALGPGKVSVRHVLAALLAPRPGFDVQNTLRAHGYVLDGLRDVLIASVQQAHEDLDLWRRVLFPAEDGPDTSLPSDTPVYAGYHSDALAQEDRLGVTRDVEALCAVLAARETRPPLSVGLFGDWGTGQSFFMERMRERIDFLASRSREAEASVYCASVVQVWFNAWHYMDANLWANLAASIFEALANHLDSEDERKKLFEQLEEQRGVLAEAIADREAAQRQLRAAIQERERVEKSVSTTAAAAFRAAVAKVNEDPQIEANLAEAANTLGISEARRRVEEAGVLAREFVSLGGRLHAIFHRPAHAVTAILVFVATAIAGGFLATSLPDLPGFTRVAATVATITAGLATAAAILAPVTRQISRAVAWLEDINGRVEKEREKQEEMQRQREAEAQQELAARKEAEQQARARVEEAEREIEEIRAGRRLRRFIMERHTSAGYREHLGIINLIRNDFQKLSELLAGTEEDARNASGPSDGLPRIDRIILYIDDLDRCPEDRVVEVLQAVHLLLAFPLFVVVVGVDSRWLLLSLEDHYAALRGREGREAADRAPGEMEWSTTPQNYLEKIFQIPFTLRPMESDGFGSLVESLLPLRPAPDPDVPEVEKGISDVPGRSERVPPGSLREGGSERGEESLDDDIGEDEIEEEEGDDPWAGSDPESGPQPDPAKAPGFRLDAASLHVEPWEREFIQRLHPLIVSPRGLKRFTNVYRFLRAQQQGEALDRFRGSRETGGEFQAVTLLLAALVGHPTEAPGLLRRVLAADPSAVSWWPLVEAIEPPPPSGDGHPRRNLRGSLLQVRAHVPEIPLATYARWAREVARFSFQSGRILGNRAKEEPAVVP